MHKVSVQKRFSSWCTFLVSLYVFQLLISTSLMSRLANWSQWIDWYIVLILRRKSTDCLFRCSSLWVLQIGTIVLTDKERVLLTMKRRFTNSWKSRQLHTFIFRSGVLVRRWLCISHQTSNSRLLYCHLSTYCIKSHVILYILCCLKTF